MQSFSLIHRLKDWWGASLRRRLLVSSVVTITFFLVLLGYLAFGSGQTAVQREVELGNKVLATLVAKDISAQYDNIAGNARILERQLQASAGTLSLAARTMLEFRQAAPLTYRALYLLDDEGRLLIHLADSLEALEAVRDVEEIIDRPSIPLTDEVLIAFAAAQNERPFLSAAHIIGTDQVPTIFMSMPVAAEVGGTSQVLVIEIDLRNVWRRIDEVYVGETGRAFVVSKEGLIIAHPDRAYVGQALAPELRPVLDGYEGQTEYTDPVSGRVMLAAYSPVGKQSGWGVVVEQERAEALAPVTRIAVFTLVVLAVGIGMATIVTTMIARSVTRPLRRLQEATRIIAHTGDLGQNVPVEGKDEVGQLAGTFNQMTASLRQVQQEIRSVNEELEGRVAERTAQLEAANRELGNLVYVASHDLRTPIRGIIQLAHWLAEDYADALDEEGREMVRLLVARTRRMHHLMEGILQYSQVGRVAEREKSIDLNQLVGETIEALSPPEHIQITVEDQLPTIVGERSRLDQVFQNLLSNAIKFMDKPHGLVRVGCVDQGDHWLFSVFDNGPGIEEKYHDKVFQMFQTLTPRDEFESTGVGLALVKKIVETWGGSVWVESIVGQGSTFFFTLPRKGRKNEN